MSIFITLVCLALAAEVIFVLWSIHCDCSQDEADARSAVEHFDRDVL